MRTTVKPPKALRGMSKFRVAVSNRLTRLIDPAEVLNRIRAMIVIHKIHRTRAKNHHLVAVMITTRDPTHLVPPGPTSKTRLDTRGLIPENRNEVTILTEQMAEVTRTAAAARATAHTDKPPGRRTTSRRH